jgi:RNA polymerase sigma-70 factor (ECF subfamily)
MKKGDPSAEMYIDYVRANHAGLRAFIRSLGVDALWVDDIAQEAFIVAYQRMEEFDEERDFGAWVRGIARNLVINERRKNARRKRIIFDNLTDVLVLSSSASEDEQGEAEAAFGMGVGSGDQTRAKMLALRECLQMIPKKSQAMIKARYEENASAPDIAERLDMKSAAVRKSLERIRAALRKCMEERLMAIAAPSRG